MTTDDYLQPLTKDSPPDCLLCGRDASHRLVWSGPGFFDTSHESEHQPGTYYSREIDVSLCLDCALRPLDEILTRLA